MANKFEIKRWEIEEFGIIYERIEEQMKDLTEDFRELEELEQDKQWNSELRKYELVWEDEEETVPKMVHKWGYVTIPEDELSEEKKIKMDVCKTLLAYIEKQL